MIHSARWVALRRATLTAQPLCARCREEGFLAPATEVHHIRPVEEAVTMAEKERLMFSPVNLRPLCHACHVKTHTEMGRSGRALNRRRSDAETAHAIEQYFGEE